MSEAFYEMKARVQGENMFSRESLEWKLLDLYRISYRVKEYAKVYIYGAGMVGSYLYDYLSENDATSNVECFLVSKVGEIKTQRGKDVRSIYDVEMHPEDVVFVSAKRSIRLEMLRVCKEQRLSNYIEIDCFDDRDYDYYSTVSELAYPLELKAWYKKCIGKELNLDNPGSFNEKINWMKLYERDLRKTELADKYLVRNYVSEKIGEQYLVPLLGVWDKYDDICFDDLPDKFVLKCNHGCGWNLIVTDKGQFDIEKGKEQINQWLRINYAFIFGFEMHYRGIKPRIIAEEYMENNGGDLYDYKFWCFNGRVEFVMFLSNRKKGLYMDNYSTEWELLPFTYDFPNSGIKRDKPDNLGEMIELAETLAEGFNYVRVDFYRLNDGQVRFGEMTFTPASGVCHWSDDQINVKFGTCLGDMIKR